MIDERGKLFGKVSIVDICIAALLIIAVLACVYKLKTVNDKDISGEDKKIVFTVEAKELREFSASQFAAGDDVYDNKEKKLIGKITNVKKVPSEGYMTKADGSIVKAEVPEKYDVLITIEADGVVNEDGYYLKEDLTQIVPYSSFSFANLKVAVDTSVKSVKEAE